MMLDVASHDADVILELTPGGEKGVADGDEDVLVGVAPAMLMTGDDVASGHRQSNPHGEETAATAMMVRPRDHHAAREDPVAETFQRALVSHHGRLHGVGLVEALEGDGDGGVVCHGCG